MQTFTDLIGAAVVLIPQFVDPNDYRDVVIEQVKQQTGRDLEIAGDMKLSVFPWLGLDIGKVRLGNAPGFKNDTFASSNRMKVQVKLMPLLSRKVEMSEVTIEGLAVNLERDASGKTNWDDLAGAGGASSEGSSSGSGGDGAQLAALAIGGLNIENAALSWADAAAGQTVAINDLNVKTGPVKLGEPVDLSVGLNVAAKEAKVNAAISLAGELTADVNNAKYDVPNLEVGVKVTGDKIPGGEADVSLTSRVSADLGAQQITLDGLKISITDLLDLSGQIAVALGESGKVSGNIALAPLDLKALLTKLGMAAPETSDPKALTSVSLSTKLAGSPSAVSLSDLNIKLDDSTLNGSAPRKTMNVPVTGT